jgi:hypothetical protein
MGKFEYVSGDTKFKGLFNVYQAKSGAIIVVMGTKCTALTFAQVNDLSINCYALADFNQDNFCKYYNI